MIGRRCAPEVALSWRPVEVCRLLLLVPLADLRQINKAPLPMEHKDVVARPLSHHLSPQIHHLQLRNQWRPSHHRQTLSSSAMPANVRPRLNRRLFHPQTTTVITITTFRRSKELMEQWQLTVVWQELSAMERPIFTIILQTQMPLVLPRPNRLASTTSTLRRSATTTSRTRRSGPSLQSQIKQMVVVITPTITIIIIMDHQEDHRW